MDPMLDDFRAVLAGLTFNPPTLPIVSNLTGELAGEEIATPDYWVQHAREAVRFADGIRTLDTLGVARQIEIGPGSTLTALARTITDTPVAPALRAKRPEPEAFANLIAHAHLTGLTPDWHALHPTAQRVDLPTYAFQRRHFWLTGDPAGDDGLDHPLLSARLQLAGEDRWAFTSRLSLATHPWIADHKVFGTVLLPGTGLVELALAAGERVGCPVGRRPDARSAARPSRPGLARAAGRGRRGRAARDRRSTPVPDERRRAVGAPRRRRARARGRRRARAGRQWPPAGAEELPVDVAL